MVLANEHNNLGTVADRIAVFKAGLEDIPDETGNRRISDNFGFSNACTAIEDGVFLGGPDLENFADDTKEFVLATVFRLIPDCELYMAFHFILDIESFRERLDEMVRLGNADHAGYSKRNNNVKVYLKNGDGKVYLCNKGTWNSLSPMPDEAGIPIAVDRVTVATFTSNTVGSSKWVARNIEGELARILGWQKIHYLGVLEGETGFTENMERDPAIVSLDEIASNIEILGGHFSRDQIGRYHAGLNFGREKHFVILSGVSGTGKTLLAVNYAKAVHGIKERSDTDPLLFICPVRPEWTDPTGLLGYYDVLTDRYVVPYFLQAIIAANAYSKSPVFIVLDEMNLARVEYYLSDILSVIETGETLRLHSKAVPLEGTFGGLIPAEISFPKNIYLTGTINIDETTSPLSDKILDRAVVIDTIAADISGYLTQLRTQKDLTAAVDEVSELITAIHQILDENGLPFGYRVIKEFVEMFRFSREVVGRDSSVVLDEIFDDRILTKLKGTEMQRGMLINLQKRLKGMQLCEQRLELLLQQLDEFGAFQNAR